MKTCIEHGCQDHAISKTFDFGHYDVVLHDWCNDCADEKAKIFQGTNVKTKRFCQYCGEDLVVH